MNNTDVRMRGFVSRTDVDDVLRLIRSLAHPLTTERISIEQAAGRVLAEDIVSAVAVPGFARAAMDGYALRGQETFGASSYNPLSFRLIGQAMPGRPFEGAIEPGQAVRIMTGAPIPSGADAVAMAEFAVESDSEVAQELGPRGIHPVAGQCRWVQIAEPVAPGKNVGQVGEDVDVGARLLFAGRMLRPQDVGVLASVGVAEIPVTRRPIVRLVITGDELLPPGSTPTATHIVDSNSLMLDALVRRDGGVPVREARVPDRREAVEAAINNSACDLMLISGGSSVGIEDHAPTIVAQLGRLLVHGIAMRPSSPTGIGQIGNRLVFLLPGNPVSCLAAYDFFAGPSIRLLGRRSPDWPYRTFQARLIHKVASAIGRVDYVRVRITDNGIEPIAISGASILSSTTRADGFMIVPKDSEGHAAGEEVMVYLYDG